MDALMGLIIGMIALGIILLVLIIILLTRPRRPLPQRSSQDLKKIKKQIEEDEGEIINEIPKTRASKAPRTIRRVSTKKVSKKTPRKRVAKKKTTIVEEAEI